MRIYVFSRGFVKVVRQQAQIQHMLLTVFNIHVVFIMNINIDIGFQIMTFSSTIDL